MKDWLRTLGIAVALGVGVVAFADEPHGPFGPVRPPLPAPEMSMVTAGGSKTELRATLEGKVTALQLMFTACTATCPIQGALFAELQRKLEGAEYQLLSVSIDANGDTPEKMKAWLARYGAKARWIGATPSTQGSDQLLDFLRGRAGGPDRHSAQTYVFDRKGQLVFRSESLPSAAGLAEVMKQVSAIRSP